jgi:hypothetical protein
VRCVGGVCFNLTVFLGGVQGVDNSLDRVGSFVTPASASLSRECRVLVVGRDMPPQLVPHAYPSYASILASEAAAAEAAEHAAVTSDSAVAPWISGVLLVTVLRGRNLPNRDTFKVLHLCAVDVWTVRSCCSATVGCSCP